MSLVLFCLGLIILPNIFPDEVGILIRIMQKLVVNDCFFHCFTPIEIAFLFGNNIQTTVTTPLKAAATIQKTYFGPGDYHIKHTQKLFSA